MRIFMDFKETREEIKRDLKEMGIKVYPHSCQNKQGEFETQEIRNYDYTILNPDPKEILSYSKDKEWCMEEATERFSGIRVNPGLAWRLRYDYWKQFAIDEDGTQDYTYPERFNPVGDDDMVINQIDSVARELVDNPDSRQCYISIWEPQDIQYLGGIKRIPCSLGYLVQVREGVLHITYMQRSCDFYEHYVNDVALAVMLGIEIAHRIKLLGGPLYKVGSFTHFIGSLHVYAENVSDAF
jgi:Thymidylate synthase